ncbi:hypothetical protein M9H77_23038 [Catharanthus roseus]|uniref:Uncharacterized protein n=1 Tax=Catharanthus roseus TaxID=4058 RepID=A0ACC0AS57_CATRO|nr:hypothetical protein M9H77_23038 [Catharanthus roseus]
MAGEQPIRPKRSLALGHDARTLSPLARSGYSLPESSSIVILSTIPATPVIWSVNFLSLGYYLGSLDEFLLMCKLRLIGTQISFMLNPLLLPVLSIFDFPLMIHAHVPSCFLENTPSLPVVENLSTKVLSIDANHVHPFINKLSPIAVLPPLTAWSSINQFMEDIDEGIERELALFVEHYNKNLVKEFYANLTEEFGNPESPAYSQGYVKGHVIDFSRAYRAKYLNCPHYSDIKVTSLEEESDFDEVNKALIGDAGAV